MTAYEGNPEDLKMSESIKIPQCDKHSEDHFHDSTGSMTTLQESDVQELLFNVSNLVEKLNGFDEFANWVQNEWENQKQNSNHQKKSNSAIGTGPEFERCTVRLDGIEVYAVVSALTVASSIACLDTYGDMASGSDRKTLTVLFDMTFTLFNIVGILTGLHSTLVFSMVTMYGRTAIGLGRDLAFRDFFRQTGKQRYKAFKTFLVSLYSFIIQCILTIAKRRIPFGPMAQFVFITIAGYFVHLIIGETNFVVDKAGVIFDQTNVGMSSAMRATRRASEGQMPLSPFIPEEEIPSSDSYGNVKARPSLNHLSFSMSSCRDVIADSSSNIYGNVNGGRPALNHLSLSMSSCRDVIAGSKADDEDNGDEIDGSIVNNSAKFRDVNRNSTGGLRRRRVSFKDATEGLKELLPRMREFDTEMEENLR